MDTSEKGGKDKVWSKVKALQSELADPDLVIGNPDAPQNERGMYRAAKVCTPSGRDFNRLAFLDPGADGSVMKKSFTDMLTLGHHKKPVGILELADGSHAPHYGIHSTTVKMTDNEGKTCCKIVHFAVMDLPENGTDFFLGFNWFEDVNPLIDWKKRSLVFCRELSHEILSIGRFLRAVKVDKQQPYLLYARELPVSKDGLPGQLKDMADVFAEDRHDDVVDPEQAYHAIDLVDGKNHLGHRYIT